MTYPHRSGLMIAVPHSGRGLPPSWAWALQNLHPPMNLNIVFGNNLRPDGHPVGKEVDELRNWFAEQAVAQGCQYLFFLDEDVVVPPETLQTLIYKMAQNPSISVIGAIYCSKTRPPQPLVFRGNGNGPYWDWKVGETFEVTGIGMGATLIRCSIFDELPKPWFKTVDDISRLYDGKNAYEAWTEDLYFCEQVVKAGKHIFADGSLLCRHYDLATMTPYMLPEDSKPVEGAVIEQEGAQEGKLTLGSFWLREGQEREGLWVADSDDADYRATPDHLPFESHQFEFVDVYECLELMPEAALVNAFKEWARLLKDSSASLRIRYIDYPRITDAQLRLLCKTHAKSTYTLDSMLRLAALADLAVAQITPPNALSSEYLSLLSFNPTAPSSVPV